MQNHQLTGWRLKLQQIVQEADTPAGKAFDVLLITLIIISTLSVILESVTSIQTRFGTILRIIEWSITIIFSVEYALRIITVTKPWKYMTSFFGIIDLLAILPAYVGLFITGLHSLIVFRIFRLLRLFRIFKMTRYVSEAMVLKKALAASKPKIIVFLMVVLTTTIILGAIMHIIEGPENGFVNIPISMYWAIVTLTTVGFGDIVPRTVLGQFVSSILMILGYGIIAVPTGIVSVEISKLDRVSGQACPACGAEGHAYDAKHCMKCGERLNG